MPTLSRKRRATAIADDEEEGESPGPSALTHNRQANRSQRESPSIEDEAGVDGSEVDSGAGSQPQIVKDLVRLALASEYSRTPIRRQDISAKVLGSQSRQFKTVFDEAQLALRHTFGMEMVELPQREKITLKERRAAQTQKTQSNTQNSQNSTGSRAWILKSVLPDKFRDPEILPPPKVPTQEIEGAYVGLYSFVVSTIMLSGGALPEAKLERYLRRTNAEVNTPVDRTDKLLQRMTRENYIVKIKEYVGGEEVIEYMVGPRGKVEIGERGVEDLVRAVYGEQEDENAAEQLEKRLGRSLKVGGRKGGGGQNAVEEGAEASSLDPRSRERGGRRGRQTRGNGFEDDESN